MSSRALSNILSNGTPGDADVVQEDLDDLLAFARADDDALVALDTRVDAQEAKVEATGTLSFTTDGTGNATGSVNHGMGVTPDIVVVMATSAIPYAPGVPARDATTFTYVVNTGVAFTAYTYRWWARKV
jgi:hypothetical protein